MIQDQSKELTLIVYNSPKPPRYLKLNKKLIRTLSVVIPLLTIFLLSIAFLYSMFLKNKLNDLRAKEPKVIQDLRKTKKDLQETIQTLSSQNQNLTQKLSRGTLQETTNTVLNFFTAPIGMEDLRAKELLKIDNIKLKSEKNGVELNFDLANNSVDKLSGYLFVIQYQKNLIQFYPTAELNEKNLRLEFSQGEYFAFSRFRPTIAKFSKLLKSSSRYKIFIFSKTGDLLGYKQVGPYNVD